MSWSDRFAPALLALLVSLPAGAAEVVVEPAPLPSKPSIMPPREDLPAAVSQRPTGEAPTLRCWQEGRLVMEQAGITLDAAPPGAHVFRRKDRNGQQLYLFDMKNGLCVLSHEATAIEPAR